MSPPSHSRAEKRCSVCQTTFVPLAANQKYCGAPCRVKASRKAAQVVCLFCETPFHTRSRGEATARYCGRRCRTLHQWEIGTYRDMPAKLRAEPVTLACPECDTEFTTTPGEVSKGRRFCGTSCSAVYRLREFPNPMGRPEVRAKISQALTGISRPEASVRMRENNPMEDPEVRAKVSASLRGRTFLARGGNGTPTAPQLRLHAALRPLSVMELAIPTAAATGQFPSLPTNYKVDIGLPHRRLAIEVDGNSHRSRKWQFLDRRKGAVLVSLGWSVLRFSNQDVLEQLPAVMRVVSITLGTLAGGAAPSHVRWEGSPMSSTTLRWTG